MGICLSYLWIKFGKLQKMEAWLGDLGINFSGEGGNAELFEHVVMAQPWRSAVTRAFWSLTYCISMLA